MVAHLSDDELRNLPRGARNARGGYARAGIGPAEHLRAEE
jgi:hypothetical protein